MLLDFQGLRILDSFLASVQQERLISDENKLGHISPYLTHKNISNLNNLSCKICDISDFNSLEEFKVHRQSKNHLNSLAHSLQISRQENFRESLNEKDELTQGSPFFEITHQDYKLQCYKVLIAHRKDENYSKGTLNLDLFLYNTLKKLQSTHIAIALNGGGYFAAAIFDNCSKKLICSKTFRKYTTRRKQGGSQSIKDNEKSGKIHSAGSLIRRENEKNLRDEIIGLFICWKPHLDKCELIFCNRDPFLSQEVFKNNDVRSLPFTTYQADSEEIIRCYNELLSIKFLK